MRKSLFLWITLLTVFLMLWGMPVQAEDKISEDKISKINIDQDHFVLYPREKGIGIREILSINNTASEPYLGTVTDDLGKNEKGWIFPLPQGFTELTIEGLAQEDYRTVKDGVLIMKALAPGSTDFVLSYTVPSVNQEVRVSKIIAYPTMNLLVVSPLSLSIQSDLLNAGETFQIKGNVYREFSVQNLTPGQTVNYTIAPGSGGPEEGNRLSQGYVVPGHPKSHIALFQSEPLVYTNPHLWAVYLFLMGALGVTALVLLNRSRKRSINEGQGISERVSIDDHAVSQELDEEELFLKLKRMHDRLLERIKALDTDYASGKLPAEQYEELRKREKELLIRVKIKLKELT